MPAPAVGTYTRFMTEMFSDEGMAAVSVAFMMAFFGVRMPVFVDNASSIEIDIVKSTGVRPAKMVHRGTSSIDTSRNKEQVEGKFTNVSRAFPLVETIGAINSNQLLDRVPGEMPYSGMTKQERLRYVALKIHFEHMRQHVTTMEFLAREAILTGQHPAIFGTTNSNYIYDFYRDTNNFITPTNTWNSGSQTIVADIDAGIDELQQNGKLFGQDYGMLVGTDAFADLKADSAVSGDADNRRYRFVELGGMTVLPATYEKYRTAGFAPRGYIETDKGRKVWLFTYDITFIDDWTTPGSDVVTDWMPKDKALLFHHMARCDRYFGPSDRLPFTNDERQFYMDTFGFNMDTPPLPAEINTGAFDSRMFHCYAIRTANGKSVELMTQSAPIMAPTHTDAFVVLQGLHTY